MKPIIGITMGDPAGVGPEIILKAYARGRLGSICRPLIIGDVRVLRRAQGYAGVKLKIRRARLPLPVAQVPGEVMVLDLKNIGLKDFQVGQVGKESGRASVEYILKGIDLAKAGEIDAIVTCPISKEAINLAGYHHPGHTEILAERTGCKDFAMMLVVGKIRVLHLSLHTSLNEAVRLVTKERVGRAIRLALAGARQLGIAHPKIGVAGLNPHAGEGGLLGREEVEEIIPAVEELMREGVQVFGPISPDTIFLRARAGEFDVVIAMYHDQGHVPLKLIGFHRGVNVTVGPPIIRTSVAHGTAFDIAGKGVANPSSLITAIRLATKMARIKNLGKTL